MPSMENIQFNRMELGDRNYYYQQRGEKGIGTNKFSGYIKCKLVHLSWGSIIVPDLLLAKTDARRWFQPLSFGPPVLQKSNTTISCGFSIDISCGHRLVVDFTAKGFINRLRDGSEIYRCTFQGPPLPMRFSTGSSRIVKQVPWIKLFHHTTEAARKSILSSGQLRPSSWNIRGSKRLTSVAYIYFTPLDAIATVDDLRYIGMAHDGTIPLQTDNIDAPIILGSGIPDSIKDEVLILTVYRESTVNRRAAISAWVRSDSLAPQHLYFHRLPGGPPFYEVTHPFIQQVGVTPGTVATLKKGQFATPAAIMFGHVVVGDATTIPGLAAPYDEESTAQIGKIQPLDGHRNMLEFWFTSGNKDLYCWDRSRARSAVGAGLPLLLFRLQGGF